MKIVIDIPKIMYGSIKQYGITFLSRDDKKILRKSIANGTPLPKGHGRLIYEPTKEEIEKTVGGQSDFAEFIRESVKVVFYNATTIIPADKGVLEKINEKQDSLRATCKAWDEAISRDGYVN